MMPSTDTGVMKLTVQYGVIVLRFASAIVTVVEPIVVVKLRAQLEENVCGVTVTCVDGVNTLRDVVDPTAK